MSIRNRDRLYSFFNIQFYFHYYIIIQSIVSSLFFYIFAQDLRELRCRKCALKKIESSLFRNIPNLLDLDVGENYVSDLLSMEPFFTWQTFGYNFWGSVKKDFDAVSDIIWVGSWSKKKSSSMNANLKLIDVYVLCNHR